MSATLVPPLRRAMVSIFEDLAMLLADDPDGGGTQEAPFAYAVRVAFTGPRSGYLELRATHAAAAAAAGNMLADCEPSEALLGDALGEIANVLCGNLVASLDGGESVFRLGAPERISPEWSPEADASTALQLENGRAEARMVLADDTRGTWRQRPVAGGRRAGDARG